MTTDRELALMVYGLLGWRGRVRLWVKLALTDWPLLGRCWRWSR